MLQKIKYCRPLVNNEIETDVSEVAPVIQFNTYLKQVYCSIHGVVPTCITTCHICETTTETDFVPGKLALHKKLFKLENRIFNYTNTIILQVLQGWFIINPIKYILVKTMYLPYAIIHFNSCLKALLRSLPLH